MNATDVLYEINESIQKLRDLGITVKEESLHDPIYFTNALLPKEEWRHVAINLKNPDVLDIVYEEEDRLAELGICFDTGCGFGRRDCELDWSVSSD